MTKSNITAVLIGEIEIDQTDSLETRLRTAFAVAHNHWLVTDQDIQFKAAIAYVLASYPEEHPDRINLKFEWDLLVHMSDVVERGAAPDANLLDRAQVTKTPGAYKMWKKLTQPEEEENGNETG